MFYIIHVIHSITQLSSKAIPEGLAFEFPVHKRILYVLILLTTACVQTDNAVQVGLQTRLNTKPANVVAFTDVQLQFYEDVLLMKERSHFPGKICADFDTVYTSSVRAEPPISIGQLLPENANLLSQRENPENFDVIFFESNGYFVYRTLVPEKKFKQFIVLDVAKKDSILVRHYFNKEMMNDLIIP